MALSLEEIRKKKADAEAQVAALEKAEQEAVAAEAGASFAGVYETLQQFGQHYTTKQRNDLKALLEPRKVVSASAGISRAPKFQIPDGTTWAGTGRQPKAFLAWAETAEGKAWKKKHPDQEWPAHPFKA
ncbi:TPA: H-NS family nucleoid-associated regulatory protein [Stenotrophomonas maltophilia]|uniref:H-NS family nucleoid-associated regulatory protein n=1 Tax=Stenotrophomonas maltophilia TaxID=40324 RepID=UPI000C160CAF|nr:H-NS family nucleoid-associated regulatory protein [Stenotrophomonas maltophilia]MBH1825936.1 H-NS histone family protein [Stenotrophomonas maltophilia]MBN5170912.1 H-NS histone family protein [Stenotrophomonas maltophilia]MCF3548480.1 H-NS histone family protein [Stenotrophomonas maltophilia]MCF3556612.1 H-NS histone family protein [Stenotrophomonas maltophilia]MCF3564123.1 H-NS histone family protein [Stenotrophomonas maltophilia]